LTAASVGNGAEISSLTLAHPFRWRLPVMIQVNANKGVKGSTAELRAKLHTRRIFNNRADELKEKKELYFQKRAKQHQQFEE
jgi:hypothetical protein